MRQADRAGWGWTFLFAFLFYQRCAPLGLDVHLLILPLKNTIAPEGRNVGSQAITPSFSQPQRGEA